MDERRRKRKEEKRRKLNKKGRKEKIKVLEGSYFYSERNKEKEEEGRE